MSLRRAIRRATGLRRAPRRLEPVEQVLRAPLRPQVQHVRHQHLTATTVRLNLTAPVRVVSSARSIRAYAARGSTSVAAGLASATFPDAVLRTSGTVAEASPAAWKVPAPSARSVHELVARAANGPLLRPGHRPVTAPTRVELVHRQPAQMPSASAADRSRHELDASAYSRPASLPTLTAQAPGDAALTDADVPRVVDHVVRELDRRLVASRERRGWTS